MNTILHPRRILLALPLAAFLPAAPQLAAQQPADSGTRFLPPNELRRAMQENYVPDSEPESTPEKNPTLGVEDRLQIQALFSAAESLSSQGKGLEATAYYQQAAANGDTTSLLRLSDLYAGYAEGMAPDPAKSEKYLRAAAAKNNRSASIRLAEIYRDGIGQKSDADKATYFYRQAMAPGAPRSAQDEVIAAAAALVLAN
jgi:TPR repeat protein